MSSQVLAIEPLLDPANSRESLYPIRHPKLWEAYKAHRNAHWISEEVDMTVDRQHWKERLNGEERHYIKYTIAFFATSDFIINENGAKDTEEVTCLEYRFFNDDKVARENIHSQSYADMLEALIDDQGEKEALQEAVKTIPGIRAKARWMRRYITEGTFVERLVAASIMEGIFFSGAFCSIFWLKKRGLMPGLCIFNEFISRDEGAHRDFATLVYRDEIRYPLDKRSVIEMIRKAVEIEHISVTESLPVSLIGMNSELMQKYICYVADHLSMALIGERIYKVENPFDWMTLISLESRTNFFEHRVTAYKKAGSTETEETKKIVFDADF